MTATAPLGLPRKNVTRTSASIPARLVRERKWHLLPLYALARTSDLAREGIEHSGSYRFADHIYRARPSGRFGIGVLIDAVLLALPAARSMRERYLHSRAHIAAELRRAAGAGRRARVLSVPCGIARELVEAARDVGQTDPAAVAGARLVGLDLDPEPLALSRALAGSHPAFEFRCGDALDPQAYPAGMDMIVSTGLGEFLDDAELAAFYAACRRALAPGGMFVTSASSRSRLADTLLRELAELHAHYRDAASLESALLGAGFTDVTIEPDRFRLQWLATARRPVEAA